VARRACQSPPLEDWLTCVDPLVGRLSLHRAALVTIREQALPRSAAAAAWSFPSTEAEWEHDNLVDIVQGIKRFSAPDHGTLASVRDRVAFARTVAQRSLADARAAWDEAVGSIVNSATSPHHGLQLQPQLGLVPLGRDPDSGLWEFAHLASGTAPSRDANGALQLNAESGLVLVLLPGGRFWMGARSLGAEGQMGERGFVVEKLPKESIAWDIGLRSGDEILALGEKPVRSPKSFQEAQRKLIPGAQSTVRLLRNGSEKTLTARLDHPLDADAEGDEAPFRKVTIEPFFLSKHEITQAQWTRIAGVNPSYYPAGKPVREEPISSLHPVENVSWEVCREMLWRLGLELPTEAEWEYAVRAGERWTWPTGNKVRSLQDHANVADRFLAQNFPHMSGDCEREIHDGHAVHAPVGSYRPNQFGLHDLPGNVWEWYRDNYEEETYARGKPPPDDAALGPETFKTARGGGWGHHGGYSRSGNRGAFVHATRRQDLGVRPTRASTGRGRAEVLAQTLTSSLHPFSLSSCWRRSPGAEPHRHSSGEVPPSVRRGRARGEGR
jgi:formylglycine-generating enzyme required for sulfatase activity